MNYSVIFFPFISLFSIGQVNIQNQVFASSGSSFSTNNFSVDYTIGECLTNYFLPNNIISQGFHQPDINNSNFVDENVMNPSAVHVVVYPNPFRDLINIQCNLNEKMKIEVFDQSGHIVFCQMTEYQLSTINLPHLTKRTFRKAFLQKSSRVMPEPPI